MQFNAHDVDPYRTPLSVASDLSTCPYPFYSMLGLTMLRNFSEIVISAIISFVMMRKQYYTDFCISLALYQVMQGQITDQVIDTYIDQHTGHRAQMSMMA